MSKKLTPKKTYMARPPKHVNQKFGFRHMEVHQNPKRFPLSEYDRVRCMASLTGTRHNMVFETRKEKDGVYVYREA